MPEAIAEYPLDQYGNPIKPGYRQPFRKGDDPRRFKGPYKSRHGLTLTDASRLIAKAEAILDEIRAARKSPKRGSRVVLQKSATVEVSPVVSPVVAPVSPTITPHPCDQSASNVKPVAVKPPVVDDDCPF